MMIDTVIKPLILHRQLEEINQAHRKLCLEWQAAVSALEEANTAARPAVKVGPHRKEPSVIFWDNCGAHNTAMVKDQINEADLNFQLFPPNMTDVLQPMDLVVNAVVKAFQRQCRALSLREAFKDFKISCYRAMQQKKALPQFMPPPPKLVDGISNVLQCYRTKLSQPDIRNATKECFVQVGLAPCDTAVIETEGGSLVKHNYYKRYIGLASGGMGVRGATKLKPLRDLQAREFQMTFADAVGRDAEPTEPEEFRLALWRGNRVGITEEPSDNEDDGEQSGANSVVEENVDGDGTGTASTDARKGSDSNAGLGVSRSLGGSSAAQSTDADVRIHDGRLAKELINKRVKKFYKTKNLKGMFHGTVKSFEVKPKNKFPVIFHVLFDEDQKWVYFSSRDLLPILDE